MNNRGYHLAQANVARGIAPLTDPVMRDFVAQIAYINSVADRAPGFVWRLGAEDGDATAITIWDDPLIVVNASVWESIEALYDYAFRSDHMGPVRRRREWFRSLGRPHSVMWWVPAGHTPDLAEIGDRLDLLRDRGPTPDAFTFATVFDSRGRRIERGSGMDRTCGA